MAVFVNEQQQTAAVNEARHLVFFPGNNTLSFNYKTGEWTELTDYRNDDLYSINSDTKVIGRIVSSTISGGAYGLQEETASGTTAIATLSTGESELEAGRRVMVRGIRPIYTGSPSAVLVRVGTRELQTDVFSYTGFVAPNARTGYANFRSTGRYVRVSVQLTGEFDSFVGVDVDFTPMGNV